MTSRASQFSLPEQKFRFGLDIGFLAGTLDFRYGAGMFGPRPEYRHFDSIRQGLREPSCAGPDPVYAIAMDVGRVGDQEELKRRMLLFGVVMYAGGRLGDEPVRSQGHVHALSPHSGWSAPELIEIWEGRAIVYAQERSGDDPGQCVAVEADPGERVVMPPGWAHYVVNADLQSRLVFGAWCDREYGFDYAQMRAHRGLAWFPLISDDGRMSWAPNPNYSFSRLEQRKARNYPELGISPAWPIYEHLRQDPESIQWVSDPATFRDLWPHFEP